MSVFFRLAVRPGLMTALGLGLLASVAPANAQISGGYTYDSASRAYFISNDTIVDGDLTLNPLTGVRFPDGLGSEVFIGKSDAATFATETYPPVTLTVNGAADGGSGAKITHYGYTAYPIPDVSGQRPYGVSVYGHHKVQINGGSVDQVNVREGGATNISGGVVTNSAEVWNDGTINVSGGRVLNRALAAALPGYNDAVLNITGGNVNRVQGIGPVTVNISGGSVNSAGAELSAVLNISGGSVTLAGAGGRNPPGELSVVNISGGGVELAAADYDGLLNVSGGTIGSLIGKKDSITSLTGGSVGIAKGYENSCLIMTGGSVAELYTFGRACAGISGGLLSGHSIHMGGDSTLNLIGAGFRLSDLVGTGIDPAFGAYALYNLSGILSDGTALKTDLYDCLDAGFNIAGSGPTTSPLSFNGAAVLGPTAAAPEPGTLALIGVGCWVFCAQRKMGVGMLRRRAVNAW